MKSSAAQPITQLLDRWHHGDAAAREELIPLLYQDLRRLARRMLAARGDAHTLQSTALVHEAYLRLADPGAAGWQNREHFFAVAARAMRHILVDRARRRQAGKRGGGRITVTLDEDHAAPRGRGVDLVALDDALTALGALDPRQARVVELRFFAGLPIDAVSRVMGISAATVKREWATARSWLYAELQRRPQ